MAAAERAPTGVAPAGKEGKGAARPPARAVLWDLDGTLLDSKLSIRETMNTVLAERGLPVFTRDELDALIGHPLRDILATKTKDLAAVEAMTHRYRAAYNESGWVTVRVAEGLMPLLERLRGEGVLTAVVTSKGQNETEVLLADLGIAHLFDAVVGDDDVRPLKPDPAPVREALALLGGVDASRAIMVGDTTFDVGAAGAAGVACVGVLWGTHDRTTLLGAGAAAVASDAPGLSKILRQLLPKA
ncbi:MAG TPA: HAD family hydrolase [Candidatus Thermoplasmatota archaeon]|nr:HAD family hydrolase [Candidatus Thermoplasmatota archaeon]